ncbi:ABC transporter permease [Mesorhizobium sp. IMUNJ 23232]|uniref:ABC transporter permease n=1 Tax=Mesorhizobium sp. IMUNJ 23232 TaxID=3376064 RepID=UPI0037A5C764
MRSRNISWQVLGSLVLALASFAFLPIVHDEIGTLNFPMLDLPPPLGGQGGAFLSLLVLLVSVAALSARTVVTEATIEIVAAHVIALLLLDMISTAGNGNAGAAYYVLLAAAWLLAWRCVTLLSGLQPAARWAQILLRLVIPAIFGLWLLIFWEAITRGAGIPFILLPPPSAVGARIATSLPILAADVQQTIFKAALAGYAMGCAAGFVVAILADRFLFLRRGLMPIGNMVSALPIIGVAPIMVMWFGFGWESKAAVVVIMTFFPMLVNTVAGLAASGHMERDLMRTYASSYWQTLFKLRLPAAAPFIFNALKINSTLALIGAIVAEFFGTPVVGMGFRISTEVGRMNIDMVWAEIAVAALAGSVFYGVVALFERAATFWHPSVRGG